MPDIWGSCNSCARWFYAGSDPHTPANETSCPVCLYPAVCLSDHNRGARLAGSE